MLYLYNLIREFGYTSDPKSMNFRVVDSDTHEERVMNLYEAYKMNVMGIFTRMSNYNGKRIRFYYYTVLQEHFADLLKVVDYVKCINTGNQYYRFITETDSYTINDEIAPKFIQKHVFYVNFDDYISICDKNYLLFHSNHDCINLLDIIKAVYKILGSNINNCTGINFTFNNSGFLYGKEFYIDITKGLNLFMTKYLLLR